MSKMKYLDAYVNRNISNQRFNGECFQLDIEALVSPTRWTVKITGDHGHDNIDLAIFNEYYDKSLCGKEDCAHITITSKRAIELRDFFGDLVKLFEIRERG